MRKQKSHSTMWLEKSGGSKHRSWSPDTDKPFREKDWAIITSYSGADGCLLWLAKNWEIFARRKGYYGDLRDSKDLLEDGRTTNTRVDLSAKQLYIPLDPRSLLWKHKPSLRNSLFLIPGLCRIESKGKPKISDCK